jgi:hypothetical protein
MIACCWSTGALSLSAAAVCDGVRADEAFEIGCSCRFGMGGAVRELCRGLFGGRIFRRADNEPRILKVARRQRERDAECVVGTVGAGDGDTDCAGVAARDAARDRNTIGDGDAIRIVRAAVSDARTDCDSERAVDLLADLHPDIAAVRNAATDRIADAATDADVRHQRIPLHLRVYGRRPNRYRHGFAAELRRPVQRDFQ